MSAPTPMVKPPRRHRWTLALVIQVAVVLAVPIVFGEVLGWFELNPVQAEFLSSVGSEAHELLSSFPDSRLVVEVAYQNSGSLPPPTALNILEQRINSTCSKNSVSVQEHPFTSSQSSFTDSDLLSLEASVRQVWPSPGTMSLFYLYLAGSYAPSNGIIGLAYRGSSIAVFESTIQSNAAGSEVAAVTTTVMVHEFGHELGLVGIIGSAPNEDPNHPGHSNDSSDVMYWAVDSTALLLGGLLGGSAPPTQFDAADLNDLGAVKSAWIPPELIPVVGTAAAVTAALALAVWGTRRVPKK